MLRRSSALPLAALLLAASTTLPGDPPGPAGGMAAGSGAPIPLDAAGQPPPPQDSAAATIGQLKNLARAARDHLDATLPGGAGAAPAALVDAWLAPPAPGAVRQDNAALTIGQLKAAAAPFYDRLIAAGHPTTYPWTAATSDDQNNAIATLGQLKNVFSFALPAPLPPTVALTAPADGSTHAISGTSWPANLATVPLSATASGTGYATVTGVEYLDGAGTPIAPGAGPAWAASWTALAPGTYTVSARATDDMGQAATSAPVSFTVAHLDADGEGGAGDGLPDAWEIHHFGDTSHSPADDWDGDGTSNLDEFLAGTDPGYGLPPAISITAPADGTWFLAAGDPPTADIPVTASATGYGSGTITSVEYLDAAGATFVTSSSAPWGFTWASLPPGQYTLSARATDSNGQSTTSPPLSFQILDPAADEDGDGLSNAEEINTHGTDPDNPDTDGDGMPDGSDADPLNPNTDDGSPPVKFKIGARGIRYSDSFIYNSLNLDNNDQTLTIFSDSYINLHQTKLSADRFELSGSSPEQKEYAEPSPSGDVWARAYYFNPGTQEEVIGEHLSKDYYSEILTHFPFPTATGDPEEWVDKTSGTIYLAYLYNWGFGGEYSERQRYKWQLKLFSDQVLEEQTVIQKNYLRVTKTERDSQVDPEYTVTPLNLTFTIEPTKRESAETYSFEEIVPLVNPEVAIGLEYAVAQTEFLLPFDLISDLNNDGEINGADNALRDAALEGGADEETIAKGTEYVFVDDNLSNGLWDAGDPEAPEDHAEDDDVQELKVTVPTIGKLWFEHGIINKIGFYKEESCSEDSKLSFPYDLEGGEPFPETVFLRAESDITVQIDGNLCMKIGKDTGEVWAWLELPLTVVREMGNEDYFHAARDYILENNTSLHVKERGYPTDNPSTVFRVCTMREEATAINAIETAQRSFVDSAQLCGIESVADRWTDQTVLINGNQVFFSSGLGKWGAAFQSIFGPLVPMTDKCHGRIVVSGSINPASSDNTDTTSEPRGSALAGAQYGRYISEGDQGDIGFGAGIVPGTGLEKALGGLSTNYDGNPERNGEPTQTVGYASLDSEGEGCVFTATVVSGHGRLGEFAEDVTSSGVDPLPGAEGVPSLLILDSGDTSIALMHRDPDDEMFLADKGTKHAGFPYFVNTYLGFKAQKPR